jgi:YVTN family beta-propeller protein
MALLMLAARSLAGEEVAREGLPSDLQPQESEGLGPTALAASPDGKHLFVGCAAARQVAVFDLAAQRVMARIPVPAPPLGLALSRDGATLYAACAAAASTVCVIQVGQGRLVGSIPVGHTAMSPVLSPDQKTLYVCNRFQHDVSVIDLAAGREVARVRVSREPVAAALSPDGRLLLVANHLYDQAWDGGGTAATLSVVDTASRALIKQIKLPRGSGLLRGVAVSPDGRFAAVTHLIARYYLPTTEVELGRINCNALSLIDLGRLEVYRSVLLDQTSRGAANPWALTWTPDGKMMAVTQAGTHEVSLIEAPVLLQKPVRLLRRIALPGNGPRALAAIGTRLYTANYFTDDLSVVNLATPDPVVENLSLGPTPEPSRVRLGERLFNDATLCRQEWQSCASCHDADGRMDGLNWDLLNDGLGNPKNAKSLVWAHRTPPAMSLGVRDTAETAVRAGLRHILFTEQPEEVPEALDAYLKSLEPLPSPHRASGALSPAAERGEGLFFSAEVGCARCHPPPRWTDLKAHEVGTRGRYEATIERYDTPTLVELWRTAPYLHDGAAASLRDVLTSANTQNRHGKTSHLTRAEMEDLIEYLLSL